MLFCEIRFVCPPVLSQLDPEGGREQGGGSLNRSEGGSGIGFGRGRTCIALHFWERCERGGPLYGVETSEGRGRPQ